MEHSAGIILFRKNKDNLTEFLMTSPGGPYWINKQLWCFPKGHIEEYDITVKNTALREFFEETSINLKEYKDELIDLGTVKQNKRKFVSIFAYYDKENKYKANSMKCAIKTSIEYPKASGKYIDIDEISSYKWMTLNEIESVPHIEIYEKIYQNILSYMKKVVNS